MSINSLYFDDITVENEFRNLLKQRFAESDIFDMFNGEVNFITMDFDGEQEVSLPAVTIYVYQSSSFQKDDEQIQAYSYITVEINVYTGGDNKVLNNRTLCNKIIQTMQSNGRLDTYYSRGLKLDDNSEVGSVLDSAYRRVIRMSGICDNKLKLIRQGE